MSHQPVGHTPGGHLPGGHLPGASGSAPPPSSSDFFYAICDCATLRGEIGGKATLNTIAWASPDLSGIVAKAALIDGPVDREVRMGQIVSKGVCFNPVVETQIYLTGKGFNAVAV